MVDDENKIDGVNGAELGINSKTPNKGGVECPNMGSYLNLEGLGVVESVTR